MMLNWVADELFVSEKSRRLLQSSGLTGFSFREVKNKSGKEVLSDVWQMEIPYLLPPGMAEEQISVRKVSLCSECGRKSYHPNGVGMHRMKGEIFSNAPDFSKTSEDFGAKLIIISQKAYRFLSSEKLDRSLVFTPVEIV